jgi:hypothetical protein
MPPTSGAGAPGWSARRCGLRRLPSWIASDPRSLPICRGNYGLPARALRQLVSRTAGLRLVSLFWLPCCPSSDPLPCRLPGLRAGSQPPGGERVESASNLSSARSMISAAAAMRWPIASEIAPCVGASPAIRSAASKAAAARSLISRISSHVFASASSLRARSIAGTTLSNRSNSDGLAALIAWLQQSVGSGRAIAGRPRGSNLQAALTATNLGRRIAAAVMIAACASVVTRCGDDHIAQ